jgi:hypothetical protein
MSIAAEHAAGSGASRAAATAIEGTRTPIGADAVGT